jgi:hypothetical protein
VTKPYTVEGLINAVVIGAVAAGAVIGAVVGGFVAAEALRVVLTWTGAALVVEATSDGAGLGVDEVVELGNGDAGSSVLDDAGPVPHAERTKLNPSPTGQASDLRNIRQV